MFVLCSNDFASSISGSKVLGHVNPDNNPGRKYIGADVYLLTKLGRNMVYQRKYQLVPTTRCRQVQTNQALSGTVEPDERLSASHTFARTAATRIDI